MAGKCEMLPRDNQNYHRVALLHSIRMQWLMFVSGLVILGGILYYQGYCDYKDTTNQEYKRLETQVRIAIANIENNIIATNLAMISIMGNIANDKNNEDFDVVSQNLAILSEAMPGVRTLVILDSEGKVLASNRNELIGRDLHERDYFATPARDNNPSILYISPPFKTMLGSFVINLSRVIRSPNGKFNGIVTAALDPEYFKVLLSSILYAPDMVATIVHGDGISFLAMPDQDGLQNAGRGEIKDSFTEWGKREGNENPFAGKALPNASDRIVAFDAVNQHDPEIDVPLYVACSRNRAAVQAGWRENAFKQGSLFALIGATAGLGLLLLQRRQRRLSLSAAGAQDLINLRLALMEYAVDHDLRNLLRRALDEVCSISGSTIGFFHFVEPDQRTLSLQAWSTRTLDEFCTADGYGQHYPIEDAGVWADCLRQRRPLIHNDYDSLPGRKGLPEGHARVVRELVVPVSRGERLTAVLGVGNKPGPYTEQDVEMVSCLADIVWEISERKQSQEERDRLRTRYQNLLSVATDGIHILDEQGNLVESNETFRTMLGYAAADTPALNIGDWDVGIPPEELVPRIASLMESSSVFETRHRRHDGTVFDVEINACGVRLDGKKYLFASSRDISARKEIENALHESRQLLSDIFDFLPDATFVVDPEKRVIAWNRAMEEMTGVRKEEILGQGDHAYTIPFYGERREQLLDLIGLDNADLEARYSAVTRHGERLFAESFCSALYNGKGAHVWAVVAPLYDHEGRRIGAVESIRDITAIKEAEANLARSNRELEQFAYVASHDLQEPLRKIAGFTELLANRLKGTLDEKAESHMWYVIDGAARMRMLINDLLNYSRITRTGREFTETDTSAVLSKVLRDLEPTIKECNAEIVCGSLPVVLADPNQLGQVFQNLIGNAMKYRGSRPLRISVGAMPCPDGWLFSVADNGIGIAPEFFERIFIIFQRLHTRAEYPGTGIGLAVCQKIIERHSGRIWVESELGTGSTFHFTMPSRLKDKKVIA